MVAIECKPAPDIENRLRRLFTLLLRHPAGDREPQPDTESSAGPRVGGGSLMRFAPCRRALEASDLDGGRPLTAPRQTGYDQLVARRCWKHSRAAAPTC